MIIDPLLRDLYAAAWMRGLEVKVGDKGDVVVVSARACSKGSHRTGLAPVVPLRPDGGDCGRCGHAASHHGRIGCVGDGVTPCDCWRHRA